MHEHRRGDVVGAGPDDGDEVGDPQQGDDDEQRLGRLPVLVHVVLAAAAAARAARAARRGPQLGDDDVHDPDEEEGVGPQHEEDGHQVEVLHVVAVQVQEGAAGHHRGVWRRRRVRRGGRRVREERARVVGAALQVSHGQGTVGGGGRRRRRRTPDCHPRLRWLHRTKYIQEKN